MQINVLKSKIHRATVTEANLDYIGSITIDEALMEKYFNKLKNRKAEKDEILLEEKRLSTLLTQKQILQKDIAAEKKLIERIQKNLEIDNLTLCSLPFIGVCRRPIPAI